MSPPDQLKMNNGDDVKVLEDDFDSFTFVEANTVLGGDDGEPEELL
jgi:hypothetical protein|tara:strand:+ start:259 stop:396 length:138 start_codon:yes stop_codon:yes gene_type:complete